MPDHPSAQRRGLATAASAQPCPPLPPKRRSYQTRMAVEPGQLSCAYGPNAYGTAGKTPMPRSTASTLGDKEMNAISDHMS